MKKLIKKFIPGVNSPLMRKLNYLLVDKFDFVFGPKDKLVPPKLLTFVGDGDFVKAGNVFFEYFKTLGGLKPWHKVLDIGCGIGRMAIPLTTYINKEGSYD